MSDSGKRRPDANATIQIDQLDLRDIVIADEPRLRSVPPPLPPGTAGPSAPPPASPSTSAKPLGSAATPAARRGMGKPLALSAAFVVLLAIAIVAGLGVGGRLGGGRATAKAPAAPSESVLVLPTIDVK